MVKNLILHKNKHDPELLEGEEEIQFFNAHIMDLFVGLFMPVIIFLASSILLFFLSSGGIISLKLMIIIIIGLAWLIFHFFAQKEKSLQRVSLLIGLGIGAFLAFQLLASSSDISGISFARSQSRLIVNLGFVGLTLLVFVGISWFLTRKENEEIKDAHTIWLIPFSFFLFFLYFLLRWFILEPSPKQLWHAFFTYHNGLEIITVAVSVYCLFKMSIAFIDWEDEGVRLTNMRLIATSDVFAGIGGEKKDFVSIDDIQNVQSHIKSYPRHWLNYGTITITTAASNKNVEIERIEKPRELQKMIMDQVRGLQKRHTNADFQRMIRTRVLNIPLKESKPKPELKIMPHSVTPSCLIRMGILKDNPVYNKEDRSIIWHKHPLFLLLVMLRPLSLLILGVALIVLLQIGKVDGLFLWGLGILLTLAFIAQSAWEIEDHRNDLYILKPNEVIDIEKLPFGPEDQRTASLGNIVNVSFETSFWGKHLGYGNVLLETAGAKGKFTFDRVPKPKEVVRLIRTYQIEFKRGERERVLNDALMLLRVYEEHHESHDERTKKELKEEILAAIYNLHSDNSHFLGDHA